MICNEEIFLKTLKLSSTREGQKVIIKLSIVLKYLEQWII